MKLLFKQSFKTIFSSKVFSIILMIIIFISSLTYTFLQTSTSAFRNSYDGLVQKGNLHDAVVKEFYNNQGTFKTVVNKEHAPEYYSIDVNMQDEPDPEGMKAPTGDYAIYFKNNPQEVSWKFSGEKPDSSSLDEYLEKMQETRDEFLRQTVLKGKPLAFQQTISELYRDKLAIKHTESLFIPASNKSFKVVKQDQEDIPVNNLITYDGTNQFTAPLSDEVMAEKLQQKIDDEQILGAIINKLRGYRWTATSGVQTVEFVDPSSFQAVISPAFAHLNHKKPISPQMVLDLYNQHGEFASIGQNPEWLKQYHDNLVWIDQIPYFVIGIGNTPDFAYPILDHSKPKPNSQNEAIVYTNLRGYQRADDSFRNSVSEKYFSLKFAPNVSGSEQSIIKNDIESIARNGLNNEKFAQYRANRLFVYPMAWPPNVKIVSDYNDTSDKIILAGHRIAFLEKIKYTIMILTTTTTSFLIIFVGAAVLLVFKSLLSARRIKHATLLALGYSKQSIASSISLITIFLIGMPSILGYIVGHFLQYPFINLFAQHWTIPTFGMAFSFLSLMITVVLPLCTIFAMVFVLSYWDLNDKISNMLRNRAKHQFSLASFVVKPLVWMGVKSKYVTSLTVANAGRLTLSTLAGIISVSAIIVGASSIGKADYAYNQTVNVTNHSFQADFSTPTAEGGQYKKISYHDAIAKLVPLPPDESQEEFIKEQIGQEVHWHIPSILDMNYAIPESIMGWSEDVEHMWRVQTYLKYKLQFKPIIDIELIGINSWDAAKKLMPENQRNNAENNELEFYKLAANLQSNQQWNKKEWFPKQENDYKVKSADKMSGLGLDPIFINFVQNSLQELEANHSGYVPYIITYDVIITNDEGNEVYTYVNGDLRVGNIVNNKDTNIIGIAENSQAFNFSNHTRQVLENYENPDRSPLIVNKYMAEKYKLGVGSVVDFDVHNHVNRKNAYKQAIEHQFEVVDVIDTYDDNRLITRKQDADAIIGLNEINDDSLDKFNGNGLFATQKNPLPLQIMPVYSEANLYIATDTISDIQWQKVMQVLIDLFFKDNDYFENINNPTDLINIYSAIPYLSMFNKISPLDISNDTFKSISKLTSDIIWIIQMISIVLSILFAVVVASLLISANNKKIATLWTLGYYRGEVMRMFVLVYLLPIIFSIGLGVPIAMGVLSALRVFVIDFGSILIPFALTWWAILIAILIIGTIFVFSTLIGIKSFKNTQARKIIKEE